MGVGATPDGAASVASPAPAAPTPGVISPGAGAAPGAGGLPAGAVAMGSPPSVVTATGGTGGGRAGGVAVGTPVAGGGGPDSAARGAQLSGASPLQPEPFGWFVELCCRGFLSLRSEVHHHARTHENTHDKEAGRMEGGRVMYARPGMLLRSTLSVDTLACETTWDVL